MFRFMDWITSYLPSFFKEGLAVLLRSSAEQRVGVVVVASALLLGCALGSAILCAVMRIKKGQTWVYGRSHCDACKKDLTWDQLIPVISFIIFSGKCKMCQTKISWIYPVSESVTGVIFTGIIYIIFL